ncbi:MAG: M28 family peptidase [Acidobacteria bacterium]|nr:M28 family peptidase [Acidobacteriota bacterium]
MGGTILAGWGALSLTQNAAIGKPAMDEVREIVSFGPRPPGSPAHAKMEAYIEEKLVAAGWKVEPDRFTAATPMGPIPMNNIVGRRAGPNPRVLILATHYDTKLERDFSFAGANDGGSGTGLLLALAPLLARRHFNHTIWLAFLDGEEAFGEWSDTDSLYGSRHLAEKLRAECRVPQIGAFLLVDMIGDRELDIRRESNSTAWLTDLVWRTARRLGHADHFLDFTQTVSDDHIPFLQAGIPAVDLIDLNYGPGNRYHHSPQDTLDKVSVESLQIVGEVLLETLAELDRQ